MSSYEGGGKRYIDSLATFGGKEEYLQLNYNDAESTFSALTIEELWSEYHRISGGKVEEWMLSRDPKELDGLSEQQLFSLRRHLVKALIIQRIGAQEFTEQREDYARTKIEEVIKPNLTSADYAKQYAKHVEEQLRSGLAHPDMIADDIVDGLIELREVEQEDREEEGEEAEASLDFNKVTMEEISWLIYLPKDLRDDLWQRVKRSIGNDDDYNKMIEKMDKIRDKTQEERELIDKKKKGRLE